MPHNITSSVAAYQRPAPTLSVLQGIALIFGTNIGAGILSLPYAARNGGFLALAIALAIAGLLCFYNEKVDIYLDGERQERPQAPFS